MIFRVKALSAVFKGKFLAGLKDLYHSDDLLLTGSLKDLQSKADFKALLDHLYSKEWVVYTKKTFKSGVQVLRYLGRYTHRIAISNNRIRSFDGLTVTFYWRDYRDNYRNKLMTLETNEFIRRFFLHVLPHGYHKIRYFGLFSLRDRWARLNNILKRLSIPASIEPYKALSIRELILSRTGRDINTCPICHKGEMQAFLNGLNHLPSG